MPRLSQIFKRHTRYASLLEDVHHRWQKQSTTTTASSPSHKNKGALTEETYHDSFSTLDTDYTSQDSLRNIFSTADTEPPPEAVCQRLRPLELKKKKKKKKSKKKSRRSTIEWCFSYHGGETMIRGAIIFLDTAGRLPICQCFWATRRTIGCREDLNNAQHYKVDQLLHCNV